VDREEIDMGRKDTYENYPTAPGDRNQRQHERDMERIRAAVAEQEKANGKS
jgi:hypothetical protein